MNEESIKRFLTTCVYQEMNSFHPSQEEDYNHEFSKKFKKRWIKSMSKQCDKNILAAICVWRIPSVKRQP